MQQPTLIDGKLPVFAFPSYLTFYTDDQSSHKQVLTLYNPYDFNLKFKVLCTSPRKYAVVESEGVIKARCCVDIVVRHKEVGINNEGVKDKFRIHVSEHGQKTIIGKKDVSTILLPTKDRAPSPEENFESMPLPPGFASPQNQRKLSVATGKNNGPNMVIILAAIICLAALVMPSQGEVGSSLPTYLHLHSSYKLIAAYVLGLVTMALLRS